MFPHMMGGWWHAHRHGCGEGLGGGHGRGFGHGMHGGGGHGDDGGSFGVRRPLRYLAYRLELDEQQTAEVARILDELKTERAQVTVDERRAVSAFADALSADALDAAKLADAAASRVRSAERLRDAVVTALGRIHALLDAEQRKKLGFLIRTGAVQF
ncbi:MAG TPA: periplasmic heavy metal sensor [Anaeromyxobacteraceae bacterium]